MSKHLRGVKPALSTDSEALTKVPRGPSHLSTHARAEWVRVMPQLIARRIITRADLAGLENYCTAVGYVRQIEEARIAAGGDIDVKLFGVLNRAAQTARQLAAEYGLTPTSRARIGSAAPEDDDDNPLAV
ncbi:phage terminase small subunit P27 family [Rhodobacter sp. KR11]|uniref:phage terminase small subunit P27 family n=1 Tax=Rhodobacter sp. KR11 TaxID=2974588 RepID=UPI00222294A0|nr:phage terminase small subunit P27 family [Rhodobacter sp. KR11]MCW1919965.1 phage terminase small subunit P27 family [Rhodobacter sp. KR11]